MVAVIPATPRHQPTHGGRTPKPSGGADFGRLLQEASGGPAPAPETRGPEEAPVPVPVPEDQAPETTPGTPAPEGEDAPSPEQATAEVEAKTETADDQAQGVAATTVSQPFVPVVPLVPAAPPAAADPTTGSTSDPTDGSTSAPAALIAAGLPATGNPAPVTSPAAKPLRGLPPTGAAAASPKKAEGEEGPPLLGATPELEQTPVENLVAKAAPPGGQHHPADLLSFDELMRPDLNLNVAPEPMLDQLQQAMNSALLEENTQLVVPQVVRGLATLVSEGISEMRLQLMPEDLGEIEVRVRTSEGVVRAELMVQNPEVKQLLDQQLDRLRQALHQQGLDLRGFDINLSADGRQPDRSRQGAQPQGGSRQPQSEGAPETASSVLAPRGAVAVDYLA